MEESRKKVGGESIAKTAKFAPDFLFYENSITWCFCNSLFGSLILLFNRFAEHISKGPQLMQFLRLDLSLKLNKTIKNRESVSRE